MAFKATHNRRHPPSHDHYARSDALLVGPGGEIVAASGAGSRIPAIPEVVTGRLEQITQASNAPTPALGVAGPSVGFVTFSSSVQSTLLSPTSAVAVASVITSPSQSTTDISPSDGLSVASLAVTSSSSTPTTSSSDSATSLAPSSTNSMSGSSTPSASSTTTASSSTAAVPTTSSDPSSSSTHHKQDVYFGIALAAIAAVGLLVVLVTWCYRTRSRSQRLDKRRRTFWPWDHRRGDMEDGFGATKEYPFGRFGSLGEKERVDGEFPYPQLPARAFGADEMLRVPHHLPVLESPFRPVIPHIHSVPDLTPNFGLLQVANYVPGDASSEEGSRANSRQGVMSSMQDTRSPAAQWDNYGPEDGFQDPWPPLRPRRGLGISSAGASPQSTGPEGTTSGGDLSAAQPLQEGWTASLRSSITSALNAMVGGADPAAEDNLTRLPEKRVTANMSTDVLHEADVHSSNTSILSNPFDDPRADAEASSPCGRLDTGLHDPSCLCEWLKQKQTSAEHVGHLRVPSPDLEHARPSPHSSYVDSPNKVTSTPSFAIPPIPVSRAGSVSSLHQAIRRKQLQRGRSKKLASRHTGILDRLHSASNSLAGSEMSREPSRASTSSGPLSDQEQFASTALRERRKRVLDAQRLAARQSLKRPSVRLGSKRQKNAPRVLAASALRERMAL